MLAVKQKQFLDMAKQASGYDDWADRFIDLAEEYGVGYLGWENYATWAVHLWLTNDPYLETRAREAIGQAKTEQRDPRVALKVFVKEDVLRDVTEPASLASDLLDWALGTVDWQEIAEELSERG